jgi:hypothetical protein
MLLHGLRFIIHYGMHLLLPGLIAYVFYKAHWKQSWLILLATMLVDLDHLLATPIYDPYRRSIGFHVLHSYQAILLYIFLLLPKKTRLVAIGLCLHMLTDYLDGLWIA